MKLSDQIVKRLTDSAGYEIAGRFEVLEEAGSGGMGTVYRARDRESGREVALKVLRELGGCGRRFERESALLARLDHPSIVRYVAHGATSDGEPYLVMEWLEGVSLSERLREDAPVTLREALVIGRDVAAALVAAHEQGIIHRDLKPSNLLLVGRRADRVKVVDFGVARGSEAAGAMTSSAQEDNLTRTGQLIGTPGYMAPEQVRGSGDLDARADLFSLGCVLFRMVAGRPAFEGDDVLSVIGKLAAEQPPRVRDFSSVVPAELDQLIGALMAKDPEHRPRSAVLVRAALERILEQLDSGTLHAPAPGPPSITAVLPRDRASDAALDRTQLAPATARRPRAALLASAAAALGLGAGLLLWLSLSQPSTREPVTLAGSAASSQEVASLPPSSSMAAPSTHDAARADVQSMARQVCRQWGAALARGQKQDGSFSLEAHRAASGWDTAQQLTPLALSLQECGGSPLPVRAAIQALGKFTGLSGGALAWGALGLSFARATLDDPTLQSAAFAMRDELLGYQRKDGSFRFVAHDVTNDFITLLGTWALIEVERLEPDAATSAARKRAVAALRQRLASGPTHPMRSEPGLAEQSTWTLLHARRRTGDAPPEDAALLRTLARELVQRCTLGRDPSSGCTRPIAGDDGIVVLDSGETPKDNLTTLWHPWATLSASALAREAAVTSDPALARELERIVRWGVAEMERGAQFIGVAAAYKLADYLLVSALLITQD